MSTKRPGRKSRKTDPAVAGSRQDWRIEVPKAAASDAGGLAPELLGDFLEHLAVPDPERTLDRRASAAFTALGARAAEQGVPLRALIDLYLSAAWRAWPQLPEVAGQDATAIRVAGQRALRTCDDVVAALADGYSSARRSLVRREESLRREFVDDLLAGTADPARLLVRAESYGLELAGPHGVLLASASTAFHEASPVLSEVTAALETPLSALDTLITTRQGQLVVVLPTQATQALEEALSAVQRALAVGERNGPPARMALGRSHPGPSGVARSFAEAREALALAANLRLPDEVVRAEHLLVYQVLLRDRAALTDFLDTVVTPLRRARGGARPLLDTLGAYLESGGNTTRTARELHLSVRAVTYRLDRIAALTGMHPGDPAHHFALHTAVLGARALGWTETVDETAWSRQ